MKKWKQAAWMAALLTGTFAAGVYAEDVLKRVDAYLRPDFNLIVDGEKIVLESPALTYGDRSYLPLKELGTLLGANVLYRGDTKTIYINSRIYPEQQAADDPTYEEIELYSPKFSKATYLGFEYPLLVAYNKNGGTMPYYRLTDVRKMGIDTEGLPKSQDKLTQFLFVSEQELKTRWGQAPQLVSTRDRYFIGGETDASKIEFLQKHIDSLLTYKQNEFTFNTKPIMINKISENDYEFLYQETVYSGSNIVPDRFILAELRLRQAEKEGLWAVSTTKRVDLQSALDKRIKESSK